MKLVFFDIETYREFFCFCAKVCDSDTHAELGRVCVTSDENFEIDQFGLQKIEETFLDCDYIISYNGTRFDLPILAKARLDIKKIGSTTSQFIHSDAEMIISFDDYRNQMVHTPHHVKAWNAKHFDMLNNCLLDKSLKQWEMYLGLRIRELPYDPKAHLTPEMKVEIKDYCFYDCDALAEIYWEFGSGEKKHKYHTLPARKAILEKEWPASLPFKFDRTAQAVAAGIIYESNQPIPPKATNPLQLFDLESFDVPREVKDIIVKLAGTVAITQKEKKALAEQCVYRGIQYGKGGCHFIKKGRHDGIFVFDVASQYPRTIQHWGLLKTPRALANWKDKMDTRMEIKALKGTPEYKPDLDLGYKVLVLNALSGGFRIRSGNSVAFDPAAGEAMCYISQLVITEMALACPDPEALIEVNTDSVFVVGEENAKAMRKKADELLQKYDMLFEEEYIDTAYFRDVNNYGIYDKDGNLLDGRGLDYSDAINKGHELAVVHELFNNLLKPELDLHWEKYGWKDFIYKWHRAANNKYAAIDGEPFDHKNYYFLWTTKDCPGAGLIQFSNDFIDTRNGSIKARYGVYAFDLETLEQCAKYIDYKQYQRDLDENFYLWGRPDLIKTFLGDTKERRLKGIKTPKTLGEISRLLYPWTEDIV